MFRYPDGLYCDVRIERLTFSDIRVDATGTREKRCCMRDGALVRVFDGARWRVRGVEDLQSVQANIDALSAQSSPRGDINSHPAVAALSTLHDTLPIPQEKDIRACKPEQKEKELIAFAKPMFGFKDAAGWTARYTDIHWRKEFYSSRDAAILWEEQQARASVSVLLAGKNRASGATFFRDFAAPQGLSRYNPALLTSFSEYAQHLKNASPTQPGRYTVLLAPPAAGILARDGIAPFAFGDAGWMEGKKICPDFVNVADDGLQDGTAHSFFDDEGARSAKNILIKDGVARALPVQGNRRAAGFLGMPVAGPTTIYFAPGKDKLDKMISGIADGLLIKSASGGVLRGRDFSLFPELAYRIEQGKVTCPVFIRALRGDMLELLGGISAVSYEPVHFLSHTSVDEESCYPKAFGGTHILVDGAEIA